MAYSHEILSTIRITQVPNTDNTDNTAPTKVSLNNITMRRSLPHKSVYIRLKKSIKFVYNRSFSYIFFSKEVTICTFYCVLAPPKQIKRGGVQNCKGKLAAFRKNKEVFADFPCNTCNQMGMFPLIYFHQSLVYFLEEKNPVPNILPPSPSPSR